MKQLYALFISLVILFSAFNNAFVFITFKINQKEIAKNLCVKKEIQNNTCKGQCYLAKQLKKAAEKEQKESQNAKEKQEVIYILPHLSYHAIPIDDFDKRSSINYWVKGTPKSISFAIFHPPLESCLI